MNREQMVERAAAVLFEVDGGTWPEDCTHPDEHRRDARAVLDAILPQVSTVEDLEALPDRAVLLGRNGFIWSIRKGQCSPLFMLKDYGPFTLVYQPESGGTEKP